MIPTYAYILADLEGGNPVSAPGVGGNVPIWADSLSQLSVHVHVALTLMWPSGLVILSDISFKEKAKEKIQIMLKYVTQ